MSRLSHHARAEILLAFGLLVGSCSSGGYDHEFTDAERDEIGDVAGNVAYDTVVEHEKIQELERRLSEVESRLGIWPAQLLLRVAYCLSITRA